MNYENVLKARNELLERIEKEEQQKYELELDLLKIDQISGDECLDIFEYETRAVITDFAIVLCGFVSSNNFLDNIAKLSNRTGWYWTKTPYDNNARAVNWNGDNLWGSVYRRPGGVRPSIPFSSISKICSNEVNKNGLIEVEYGEYPQWICSNELSEELEELYKKELLNKTGKSYTTDSINYHEFNKKFEPQEHIEYEYEGKKYVRVKVNSCYAGKKFKLSNGEEYKDGYYVWISVSPIKWLVDKEKDIALTKNIIVSGIQFNMESNYDETNFNDMNIKRFMDKYLSKDIIPSNVYNTEIEIMEETFEGMREEARRKLREILGDDFDQVLNNSEDNYQKQLKK